MVGEVGVKILGVRDGEMSAHRIYTSNAHLFCVVEGDLRAGMSGCLGVSFFFFHLQQGGRPDEREQGQSG